MRPNDMPRPFAPDHSEGAATGDLIERLRQQAAEIASAGHNGWGDTMIEAADELARLRAEVEQLSAEQTNILQSACEATDEVNRLRKMNEGMRQQHATDSMTLRNLCSERDMQRQRAETAERERDELRLRIAEAPIAHADLFADGEARIVCIVPKDYAGQRVALVRLDAEEGK